MLTLYKEDWSIVYDIKSGGLQLRVNDTLEIEREIYFKLIVAYWFQHKTVYLSFKFWAKGESSEI
jgi:hypothetical protein